MNDSETTIECKKLVNSAGLFASNVANTIEELKKNLFQRLIMRKEIILVLVRIWEFDI